MLVGGLPTRASFLTRSAATRPRGWKRPRRGREAGRSAHREAEDRFELREGRVRLDDLDRRHAERPRALQVRADVVEEDGLGRNDAERLACDVEDPWIRLANPEDGRLDERVELRAQRRRSAVVREPVVGDRRREET